MWGRPPSAVQPSAAKRRQHLGGCPTLVAFFATEPALSEAEGVGNLTSLLSQLPRFLLHPASQLLLMSHKLLTNRSILERNHLCRKNPRISSPRLANGNRRHRNSRRHLHGRQQRIHPLQRRRRNRHANHRKSRMSRNHPSQMCRPASSCDDHANPAPSSLPRKVGRPVRRSVRRSNINLITDPKLLQSFPGLAHNLKVRITPHHNRNQSLTHLSPYLVILSEGCAS